MPKLPSHLDRKVSQKQDIKKKKACRRRGRPSRLNAGMRRRATGGTTPRELWMAELYHTYKLLV
jgi:hypothetical protein